MATDLIEMIASTDPQVRDRPLEAFCRGADVQTLVAACDALDNFRRKSGNLYQRVRALFFLSAIYRYHLPQKLPGGGKIPFEGYRYLLHRRFDEAIEEFLVVRRAAGISDAIASALAAAYRELGFQTLANQVRQSVRSARGNQWMFRTGHPSDHPLRIRAELLHRDSPRDPFPILVERTPVRMDLSHSAWSDIFFLGMDFPEGARVLNVSIDLAVRGRHDHPRPPIEASLRVIDQPVLRLVSVDLKSAAEITSLAEVFDFAKDYLGLLKAAVIASGVVPPGLEGSEQSLVDVLGRVIGPGLGLELVSTVNDIPKGSRLAVSTNLLAALIAVLMRATGQARALTGTLEESERRVVASRAILGEWLGGSGGGWQDSGGIWPGIKRIEGALAAPGDPEFGVSRGRLLPEHRVFDEQEIRPETRQKICDSFILVHGGMAQNVGPILEMVTEKYLLRSEAEWQGRKRAIHLMQKIEASLRGGNVRELAAATTENFSQPLQAIIPWASNAYTESLIRQARQKLDKSFWGFLMLGGMSGGGMGFIVDPSHRAEAQDYLQTLMSRTKQAMQEALPFAMEPVVYDFAINPRGTEAMLLAGRNAFMPPGYYAMLAPQWLRSDLHQLHAGLPGRDHAIRRGLPGPSSAERFDGSVVHAAVPPARRRGT